MDSRNCFADLCGVDILLCLVWIKFLKLCCFVYVHCNFFFFGQSGKFGKINKAIRFPEYLNLSSYMSTTDDCSPVYRLYAVVVHHDVMNAAFSGHYVCYVKDSPGKWHKMDDSQVNSNF